MSNNFSEFSCNSRGENLYKSDENNNISERRWYQHDIDTIVYSDMFRKLQRKSQLFSPQDPLSRSRLIHTLEVVRIAKEISEKLGLNTELTEGIALGHDFANVAYGKMCDSFLSKKTQKNFKHEEVSKLMLQVLSAKPVPDKYRDEAKRIVDKDPNKLHELKIDEYPYKLTVFKEGKTYCFTSITPELLDGVVKHGTNDIAFTLEGQVVNYADNIAYLIQDICDLETAEILTATDKERYTRSLNKYHDADKNKNFPIENIVAPTEGLRTGTLIERFVSYNLDMLNSNNYRKIHSPILDMEIPVLSISDIDKKAIDDCWNFKNEFYSYELIAVSNINASSIIKQLWSILDKDTEFTKRNSAYLNFDKLMLSPIFLTYKNEKNLKENQWTQWKKACFVSYLSCDEIDLIINSFLSRDYTIDLTLPKIII